MPGRNAGRLSPTQPANVADEGRAVRDRGGDGKVGKSRSGGGR